MRYLSESYTVTNTNGQTTTTGAFDLSSMTQVSAQAVFSDNAAAGTLKLQVSNDPPASTGKSPTNWSDVSGATATVASGATSLIVNTNVSYCWGRIAFASTGGSGTIAVAIKTNGY